MEEMVMKKKLFLLGMAIGGLVVFLTGCEALSSSSSGCPNDSCHVFADAGGNGSYDVCSNSSCSAYKVPYPVPANTNVKCNCN
jgi:hypothetical protein